MPEREAIRVWRTRLRWRLRGAWQWPVFAVLTVVDAVVLARLPFSGGRANLVGSLLAAGLLNVVVVAVVSPLGGAIVRRRRPQLPALVAADQAGTAGLVAVAVLLVVGGVLHRPALRAADDDRAVAIGAAMSLAAHRAPARYLPLHGADTWEPGPHLFRTCFAGPDPRRDFCVVVRTDEGVPVQRVDPDQRPNNTIAGSDNPGRMDR
jgi:hypothetical protein